MTLGLPYTRFQGSSNPVMSAGGPIQKGNVLGVIPHSEPIAGSEDGNLIFIIGMSRLHSSQMARDASVVFRLT
jgi:hypothetical protein